MASFQYVAVNSGDANPTGTQVDQETVQIPRIQNNDLQILPPDNKVYDQFKNMVRVGLDEQQIKSQMLQRGLDPNGLFNNPLPPTNTTVAKKKKKKKRKKKAALKKLEPSSTEFNKYIELLEAGMQEGPVLLKVVYDGIDPEGFLMSDAYNKYLEKEQEQMMNQKVEILKMTLPTMKVKKSNKADFTGVHSILGEFFAKKLQEQTENGGNIEKKKTFFIKKQDLITFPPNDATYTKYIKMFSVGLREPQVFHKLLSDGLSPEGFMNSDAYQGFIADQQKELMQQKLDILQRFLPKMQLLQDKERAKTVSKNDFAEVQKALNSFLSDNVLKRQEMIEKQIKLQEESKFTPPPVELLKLEPDNALFEKYGKMLQIGLKEGAVLHKVVYDGIHPESFFNSNVYQKHIKEQQNKLMKQKLRILDIFLPKAHDEPGKGDFKQVHETLAHVFENNKKKKKSSIQKKRTKVFETLRPKKLQKLPAEDPAFDKYVKMIKIGLSETQVLHKVVYDGIEPESFLDSAAYKKHTLEQKELMKQEKIELLRQFLPNIHGEDDEDEGSDAEDDEEEGNTLTQELGNLQGKLDNFFGGFSLWG